MTSKRRHFNVMCLWIRMDMDGEYPVNVCFILPVSLLLIFVLFCTTEWHIEQDKETWRSQDEADR